ncbi:restriction endonuclease subunit S [Acinetobacter sp. YH12219]|uniref:restriction endonuclease subunit S n=1 Tax=Acinetobacter sp. YH12219 TaxID=2601153 RepID=UPI0015D15C65|nr:restriction endonuclease subunit S [Acinetobacter sp. YH12219]
MAKYQKYTEYKDSGIEWLGEIPSHWESKKLKYLLDDLVRGPFGSALKKDFFVDSGFKVYEQKNCIRNDVKIGDSYVPKKIYEELERFSVKPYDLLMSCSGTIGKVVQVPDQFEIGIINQALLIMRLDYKFLSSQFFLYSFRSDDIQNQIKDNTQGGAMQNLVATDIFKSISFAIPPIIEQNQIANFLDHETAKIDSLITKQEKLIELLKEKRQAVISHAVTKGLNPDVNMKDSGVEWLGQVPEHWKVAPIKRIIQLMEQGKSPECENIPATLEQWGVLKTSCVNNGIFHSQQNKALPEHTKPHTQYQVKAGDVLMSRASGSINLIGSVALVPNDVQENLLLSDKIFRIHLTKDCDARFFTLLMATPYMRTLIERAISGAEGMANNITKTSILEFVSAIPPLKEQVELVEYLAKKIQAFDSLVVKASQAIELMQERRTALISSAVTGKIDVRNWQNPNHNNNEANTELGA